MIIKCSQVLPVAMALLLLGGVPWSFSLAASTDDEAASQPTCAKQGKGCCRGHGGGHGGGCGRGKQDGSGKGKQHRYRGGQENGCCMGGGEDMEEVRDTIHGLLDSRESIQREVEEVDGGVITTTTSEDPQVTDRIRFHVMQMESRLENGQGMRMWDPLFREIFAHHEEIKTEIEEIPGGVKVRQTSDNPEVTALIRQHATRGVSEFIRDGYERVHETTPLPEADSPTPLQEADSR
jgi:hypothetical protein